MPASPDRTAFRFLTGEEHIRTFMVPDAERLAADLCALCGSLVPSHWSGRTWMLIPAGTMDDDVATRPEGHVFVADKAPWFEITDRLPQFEGSRPV